MADTHPTKTRPGDQQLPNGGRECVQDALIALIEERKQLGIQRYGSPLMTHNGRDSVRDATEEALDLTVYLMQVAMEMRDLRAERDHALARAEHAEEGAQLSSERLAEARAERDAARLVSKGRTMEEHDQAEELTRLRALEQRVREVAASPRSSMGRVNDYVPVAELRTALDGVE